MVEASSVTGVAKAVLEFAREARSAHVGLPKVDVSILTFSRGDSRNGLADAARDLDLSVDVVSERRRFDTEIIPQLRSLIARRRPDVIWSNSIKSHFIVRSAGLHHSAGWVAFHHGYTATDAKMLLYNQLDRWSLPAADRVLTSSQAFSEELQRRNVSAQRIQVQRMPVRAAEKVPEARKAELHRKLGLQPGMRVLLCVARLSREKGHAVLLKAFARMLALAPQSPLKLVLLGAGPEQVRIEKMSRTLNLHDSTVLAGHQADVAPYYAIADAVLLPSLSEGCPNVLLEAMAAGVPVVATSVGGVPEIVTNEVDALLVKANDPEAFAQATLRLLADTELRTRLTEAGRSVLSRHSPKAYFESLVSVFSEACAQRASLRQVA
jgi:glycosyltransferase involved in cell wall biosynthesis